MYRIDRELLTDDLTSILSEFHTKELPRLNHYKNYYDGKQKILFKEPTDEGRPNNKIVVNYCYYIVNNYLGYLAGIPIKYHNDTFEDVLNVIHYNDVANEDTLLLRNALIYGVSYEINYIDEDGKQRFRVLDSRECIPVYDNTLNNELKYVIRFWKEDAIKLTEPEKYYVEVYSDTGVKKYKSASGFSGLTLIEERPNFYGMCPISIFKLNNDEKSIFDQIISLQDAYNELLSSEVDDFDSFADAYLILKGMTADNEDLQAMKKNRCILLDPDSDASYLTKSISDTQIENMLDRINDQIHKITNSPDFNDDKFLAQSGIALRYRLVGFENAASDIESYFRKCLQRRIELISQILNLTGEQLWRDVEIIFTRNLPQLLEPSNPNELIALRGLVSDETLLSLLPFVDNPSEELEKAKKESEDKFSLYGNNEQTPFLLAE